MSQKDIPWEGTLFKMNVRSKNNDHLGKVKRESDKEIIVFTDDDAARWDIPKGQIQSVEGRDVVLKLSMEEIKKYQEDIDKPMPKSMDVDPTDPERSIQAGSGPGKEAPT